MRWSGILLSLLLVLPGVAQARSKRGHAGGKRSHAVKRVSGKHRGRAPVARGEAIPTAAADSSFAPRSSAAATRQMVSHSAAPSVHTEEAAPPRPAASGEPEFGRRPQAVTPHEASNSASQAVDDEQPGSKKHR
jgi:hypothetical protein